MRRLLAALAGLLGLAWLRSRAQPPAPSRPDPAEALRAKLAEARAADDREEFEAGEKPVDEVPDDDVAVRRREVHERARRQIDELRGE
ncbi:MAG TPA: hypothetical protein VFL60_04775 [Gaiellaceae bacterium]|nr:hypothetical protein [Gaiellaceae bacterium]